MRTRANQLSTASDKKEINCPARSYKYLFYFVFVLNLWDIFPLYSHADDIKMDLTQMKKESLGQGIF